ncbi:Nn.00g032280.m01.CDS01 [Neocucurbitaria sp. VM-36]
MEVRQPEPILPQLRRQHWARPARRLCLRMARHELQKGMDATNCMGAKCKDLKNQVLADAKACSVKKVVQDDLDSWHTDIPGQGSMPMQM